MAEKKTETRDTSTNRAANEDAGGAVIAGRVKDAATQDESGRTTVPAEQAHDTNFDPPNYGDQEQSGS